MEYGTPRPREEVDTSRDTMDPLEVVELFNELCFRRCLKEAFDRCISPNLIVHDPDVQGGNRDGLFARMSGRGLDKPADAGGDKAVLIVDKQFASGPFVTLMHHVFMGPEDRGAFYIDVIYVENGKIKEFWNAYRAVPEASVNPNKMW